MGTTVVILAAGQGKRMRSAHPKVLQPLGGEPLLAHVLAAARALRPREVRVVFGHGGEAVQAAFAGQPVAWFHQAEQRGTGHAVRQALPGLPADDVVLVLYGDVPLIRTETLRRLVARARRGELALLTADFADPAGYGRILRGERGRITGIVEEKDATPAQRGLREVNTGLLACPAGHLARWIRRLKANNAQGEYYLTDIVGLAAREEIPVAGILAPDVEEVFGVNDRRQLAEAERILQRRRAGDLLDAGVTLADPGRLIVRGRVRCGRDVFIDAGVILEGDVTLGDGVRIGPWSLVRDATLGPGTVVQAHSVIEAGRIGAGCEIGPYARVRPDVELADGAKLGNFVEIKKSVIGRGSKVNHLTYIGDATIGAAVNVGAGTITCNYDGASKHRTIIGDGAFIGSGVELVAPVEIGAGATIGAGSTITKTAPPGALTVARARQATIPGWQRPVKAKKGAGH